MYKYYLKHNISNVYLKYYSNLKYKHYVSSEEEATLLTYQKAYYFKNKFKHPENWTIKRKKVNDK